MDDVKIVAMYWARNESAIAETSKKYGSYCHTIAYNILSSNEDAEECVNDTYLRAWNAIPPQKPNRLAAFLGRITRNLALDKLTEKRAKKRGREALPLLEELAEAIPDHEGGSFAEELMLKDLINSFLNELPKQRRIIFMRRYFFFDSVKEIAQSENLTEANVKVILHRTRLLLQEHLAKEGITL